jgi:hypothetical protein
LQQRCGKRTAQEDFLCVNIIHRLTKMVRFLSAITALFSTQTKDQSRVLSGDEDIRAVREQVRGIQCVLMADPYDPID